MPLTSKNQFEKYSAGALKGREIIVGGKLGERRPRKRRKKDSDPEGVAPHVASASGSESFLDLTGGGADFRPLAPGYYLRPLRGEGKHLQAPSKLISAPTSKSLFVRGLLCGALLACAALFAGCQ